MVPRASERSALVLLALMLSACGGEESWLSRLKDLSSTPSCYTPPPEPAVPEGTNEMRIAERIRRIRKLAETAGCVDRYQAMFDRVHDRPQDPSWQLRGSAAPLQPELIDFSIPKSQHDDAGTSGRFLFDVERTAEIEEDICMREETQIFGTGSYTPEYSMIEQGYFLLHWTDSAVAFSVRVPPFGEFVRLMRGCDPDNGVSFALLPNFEYEQDVVCWSGDEYISCEGTQTWPPDLE